MKLVGKVFTIALFIILIPILVVNLIIIIKSYAYPDKIPDFMGWKPFITLSGSMETEISTGDLVFVKEIDPASLKVGDVIAFRESDDIVVTHRIVEITTVGGETKFVTKGDNNNAQDLGTVSYKQVEGKYEFKIDRLGNVVLFIQTPIGIIVALSIPVLLYLLFQVTGRKKDREYIEYKNNKEAELQQEIERLKKENDKLHK